MNNLNKPLESDERTVHQAKFEINAGAFNWKNKILVGKTRFFGMQSSDNLLTFSFH